MYVINYLQVLVCKRNKVTCMVSCGVSSVWWILYLCRWRVL